MDRESLCNELTQMAFKIMTGIGYMGLSQWRQGHEIEPRWAQTGKLEIELWRSNLRSWTLGAGATAGAGQKVQ